MNKISVVVPVFNGEKYIEKAIKSIINQTTPVYEIIIIDDGSRDNTAEIVKTLLKEHNYIKLIQQKNKGVSYARNVGVKLATTDCILFLDADDLLDVHIHERYQNILNRVKHLDDYVLCYCKVQELDSEGDLLPSVFGGFQMEKEEAFGHEILRNRVFSSGLLVRRETFLEVGGFDTTMSHAEDWDLWLRLARVGGFLYSSEISAYIRRHNSNASKKIESMLEGENRALKKYSIQEIREGIFKRPLSFEENQIDYLYLLMRLKEWDACHKELCKLDLENCSNIKLLFFCSLLAIHEQDFKKSEEVLKRILHINSCYPEALNNLGALLLIKNNKEESTKLFLNALTIHKNYIDAQHNLKLSLEQNKFYSIQDTKITRRPLRENLTTY